MLKKLKSALGSPRASLFRLAGKALVFLILLLLSSSHWLFILAFLAASLYLYFRPVFGAKDFSGSFGVILGLSLLLFGRDAIPDRWRVIIALVLGVLFFLLSGVKNMIFVKRRAVYQFLNNALIFGVFLIFFGVDKSSLFIFKYFLAGLALYLLLGEFLNFASGESAGAGPSWSNYKNKLAALIFTFITLEFIWAVAYLPIGFLNSASMALIAVIVLEDVVIHHRGGSLSRQIILRNSGFFLLLATVILGFSRWSP